MAAFALLTLLALGQVAPKSLDIELKPSAPIESLLKSDSFDKVPKLLEEIAKAETERRISDKALLADHLADVYLEAGKFSEAIASSSAAARDYESLGALAAAVRAQGTAVVSKMSLKPPLPTDADFALIENWIRIEGPGQPKVVSAAIDVGNIIYNSFGIEAPSIRFAEVSDVALGKNFPASYERGRVLQALGISYSDRDSAKAIGYLDQAIAVFRALPTKGLDVATTLSFKGYAQYLMFDIAGAEASLAESRKLWEELGSGQVNASMAYSYSSTLRLLQGRPYDAGRFLAKAIEIRRTAAPKSPTIATLLANMGVLSTRLGDQESAIAFQKQAFEIASVQMTSSAAHLVTAQRYSQALLDAGRVAEFDALAPALTALLDSAKEARSPERALLCVTLGSRSLQRQKIEEAKSWLERAEAFLKVSPDPNVEFQVACFRAMLTQDDPKSKPVSEDLIPRYEQLSKANPTYALLPSGATLVGQSFARSGDHSAADGWFRRAWQVTNELGLGLNAESVRTFERTRSRLVNAWSRSALTRGKTDFALQVVLAGRGEALRTARIESAKWFESDRAKMVGPFYEQIRSYQLAVRRYSNLPAGLSKERMSQERSKLDEAKAQFLNAQRLYGGGADTPSRDRPELKPLPKLDANSAALVYQVDADSTRLYLLTSTGVRVFPIQKSAKDLESLVREVRNRCSQPGASAKKERDLLSTALLPAGVRNVLKTKKRLIILPDGCLWSVPFSALLPGGLATLGETHALVFGISSEDICPSRSGTSMKSAVGFGFYDSPAFASAESALRAPTLAQSDSARVAGLKKLPGAQAELQDYKRSMQARLVVGDDATRDALFSGVKSADLVHVACHAFDNPSLPWLSGLVLSDGKGGIDIVRAWELNQMGTRAKLVVLSACQTSGSIAIEGDTLSGLGRSFLAGGAQMVLTSDWLASDGQSAQLMSAFYAAIRKGTSPELALQQSIRALRAKKPDLPPFFFAGFRLIGAIR